VGWLYLTYDRDL